MGFEVRSKSEKLFFCYVWQWGCWKLFQTWIDKFNFVTYQLKCDWNYWRWSTQRIYEFSIATSHKPQGAYFGKIPNVRKVMAVYCENNTESVGSMHCREKIGEIRVFGKAVRTRTTAPNFRKAQIEHCRNSKWKELAQCCVYDGRCLWLK